MAADGRYAWEKLYLANRSLAAGLNPIRGRLRDAIAHNLLSLNPANDFPWPDLRQRIEALMSEFIPPQGLLDDALAKRSDFEITKIVLELTSIYDSVARRVGDD